MQSSNGNDIEYGITNEKNAFDILTRDIFAYSWLF